MTRVIFALPILLSIVSTQNAGAVGRFTNCWVAKLKVGQNWIEELVVGKRKKITFIANCEERTWSFDYEHGVHEDLLPILLTSYKKGIPLEIGWSSYDYLNSRYSMEGDRFLWSIHLPKTLPDVSLVPPEKYLNNQDHICRISSLTACLGKISFSAVCDVGTWMFRQFKVPSANLPLLLDSYENGTELNFRLAFDDNQKVATNPDMNCPETITTVLGVSKP